jgi:hypothetical protein
VRTVPLAASARFLKDASGASGAVGFLLPLVVPPRLPGSAPEQIPTYAFACESRNSPKQVKPTITASMKYCEREALRTLS